MYIQKGYKEKAFLVFSPPWDIITFSVCFLPTQCIISESLHDKLQLIYKMCKWVKLTCQIHSGVWWPEAMVADMAGTNNKLLQLGTGS